LHKTLGIFIAMATIFQIEDALLSGPIALSGNGAQGSYADYQNTSGDYIEWTVDAPVSGLYDLSWRYANGETSSRPLKFDVNGVTINSSLNFPSTTDWLTWNFATQAVALKAGVNRVRLTAMGDSGANFDYLQVSARNQASSPGAPISPLPFAAIRVEGSLTLDFDGSDGGIVDKDGQSIGFTMIDPVPNSGSPTPVGGVLGYRPENLDVIPGTGDLRITTTPGVQYLNSNSLENALGVGLNVPSAAVTLSTTLVDLPTPVGGHAQAGLWFGEAGNGTDSSQDNYIKLVVRSDTANNYLVEALMEVNGQQTSKQLIDIPENQAVNLSLFVDPTNKSITTQYSVGNGALQTLTTFTQVPSAWFSFDQAGIIPEIGTRSFGGVFASHRNAPAPQVFTFDKFNVSEKRVDDGGGPQLNGFGPIAFDRWSIPVDYATDMSFGPDGKLYVATLNGEIRAIKFDRDRRKVISNELINTIKTNAGGDRLTLGLAVDPDSTADNVILWVAHSGGSIGQGTLNSGKLSRLSGPGFRQIQHVVEGLPRALSDHATNNIEFGPDGKLYVWQGSNTGAGAATLVKNPFGDRPEQVLSAALLSVDIPKWKANPANFHGKVAPLPGEFMDQFYARKARELGRPFTEVQVYATGLRNTYDGVFHSNGQLYAGNNGLGVVGATPPVPRLGSPNDRTKTTLLGTDRDNPGEQSDVLNRIIKGGYYGHPNPYRDEVVFKDGRFQNLATDPDYQAPLDDLGLHRSPNGMIEYTADNFFGLLKGDLLVTNFSTGDNLTRIELSPNGKAVLQKSTLTGGFSDPLPLEMGPDGSIFVGEFNGGKITILESKGVWRSDLPKAPIPSLDSGSAVLGDRLYMVGGKNASGSLTSLYIYDPGDPMNAADDRWFSGPNKPGPAVENAAVVGLQGKLYVFGGSTAPASGVVGNAAVYTPDANPNPNVILGWNNIAPMRTPRAGAVAEVLNGDIYVIGGIAANGASVNTVEIYDPDTNTWRVGPSMQTRRDNFGAAVIDKKLYVMGGQTRNSNGTVILDTLEIFNPLTGQWSSGSSMPTGRHNMMVGKINGRIQVIGGAATANGANAFMQNEEYNPRSNTWRTMAALPRPRQGAAFGTIDDIFYVAGGGMVAGNSFSNLVEAFSA
jgi:large repetitive protein